MKDLREQIAELVHHKLAAAQNLRWQEGDTCDGCYGVADEILALLVADWKSSEIGSRIRWTLAKHYGDSTKNEIAANELTALAESKGSAPGDDTQIKYMVNRFLGWRLPENFNPDAGISFKRDFNENTAWPMKHEPTGTNLFDATQAEEMIRYMIDGIPAASPETSAPLSRNTCDYCHQDLGGMAFDGHYTIYCHKPTCEATALASPTAASAKVDPDNLTLDELMASRQSPTAASDLRDVLNRHYWRDGKGCSCEFWYGDYNSWMVHVIPFLRAALASRESAAAPKGEK